jgi:SP family xylose:H+ symportor-like MFS transporter
LEYLRDVLLRAELEGEMPANEAEQTRTSKLVLHLARVAALGGLVFGCSTAVISGVVSSIDAQFIHSLALGETARNTLSGLTVSSALFGCVLGSALAGGLSARFGRRGGMLVAAILLLGSALGSAAPELGITRFGGGGVMVLWTFFAFRFLCGIAVGLIGALSPLYISEISPPAERGRLVTYFQLAVVSGVVTVYFTNWFIASAGDEYWLHAVGWRLMLGSTVIPVLIFVLLLQTLPDTPRSLVMRGRSDEALSVLRRLVREEKACATLAEIEGSLTVRNERLLAFGTRVLLLGFLLAVFQQLVGINAILYYLPLLAHNMGASDEGALFATAVTGGITLGFTFIAMFTIDAWGRKPLLVLGALILAASMFGLSALLMTGHVGLPALIAVGVFLSAFSFSWGPVTAVVLSEMFPNAIRSQALGLTLAVQWIANILVSWTFRILDGNSALNGHFNHGFTYLLYGVMSLIAALFVYRFMPETKGKPLEAIQLLWK